MKADPEYMRTISAGGMEIDSQTVPHHPQWGSAPPGARPVPHPPGLQPPGSVPSTAPSTPSIPQAQSAPERSPSVPTPTPGTSIPYSAPATLSYTREEGRGEQWTPTPSPARIPEPSGMDLSDKR